jgi:hypothetical protein
LDEVKDFSPQAAETVCQLRSRLANILNVPQGYVCGVDFSCGLAAKLFEQPANRLILLL